ncbi:MAG TPA: endospore germination permease [Ruminiclostridium sp.]|nr:endospore germination permease [Ruminiclostridium sp.]
MDKEVISTKQAIFTFILFNIGSFIIFGSGSDVKQDVWISILLGLIMSLPMLFIYSRILMLYPGKDLYDIILYVFGKILGRFICLVFLWYSFHLGTLVIRNFSGFVNVVSFPETPPFIFIILITLLAIWIVKAGIEVLGRWSAFIFPITISIITLTIMLSMSNAHFLNLKPLLYNGLKPVFKTAFSIYSFPFAESVILTMVFNTVKEHKKIFKVFLVGNSIGCLTMTVSALRNILVLGPELTTNFFFPSYIAVRTVNIGDFVQRFEIVVAIVFIFGGFIKISVCLLAATKGLAKLFSVSDYRQLTVPVGFLMVNFANIIYESDMEMFYWATKIYQFYAIPFQLVFPVIILIAAKIKQKAEEGKQGQEPQPAQ